MTALQGIRRRTSIEDLTFSHIPCTSRRQTFDSRKHATSAPAELGVDTPPSSRKQTLRRSFRRHGSCTSTVYGSGTSGALLGIHQRGVQWIAVVLYDKLVYNSIQITTSCFHCIPPLMNLDWCPMAELGLRAPKAGGTCPADLSGCFVSLAALMYVCVLCSCYLFVIL